MSRSVRTRLLVPVAVCSLLLGAAACGGDDDKKSSDAPKSEFATPPSDLVVKVVKPGTGAVVQNGDPVTIEYQGTNWTTGEVFDQSYGKGQDTTLATDRFVPGFGAALVGQKVGAQVLVSIPPEFGYGEAGQPSANIGGTDTLAFVIEIKAIALKVKGCNAKPGPASNAVKVTGAFGKTKPKATFAKPLKANGLQRTVLKAGKGATTKAGDNISLMETIYNGRTGKQIESSPLAFKIGAAGDQTVPEQFETGASCVKIGSRVVTAFPAKDLTGPTGNEQAGIKPTDTLVLVTDVIEIATANAPAAPPATKPWADAPQVTFNGDQPPTLTLPKA